ncbi:hypothetical protein CROQUDRAFT_471738 [Cronartium quercuum f. sp. fusiforme G11]|uniref:Uncharacterized protein n=1 Tax=Cronartium quercuum f. sp. fusiforme G11 TaxID=708437 RepID=A0A9P6NI40_9BASI|nr:hypothetical protein CROQUDRAFT_471738 [Cronartium quercuum f. sp. fusiforme G11]
MVSDNLQRLPSHQIPTCYLSKLSNLLQLHLPSPRHAHLVQRLTLDLWAVATGLRQGCLIDGCSFPEALAYTLSAGLNKIGGRLGELIVIHEQVTESTFVCSESRLTFSFRDCFSSPVFVELGGKEPVIVEMPKELENVLENIQVARVRQLAIVNGFGPKRVSVAGWLLDFPVIYVVPGHQSDWTWRGARLKVVNVELGGQDRLHQLTAYSIPAELEIALKHDTIVKRFRDKIMFQLQALKSDDQVWKNVEVHVRLVEMDQVAL